MNESFVSLFAGIEGTGLGLERAGWKCVAQVENNAFCNRVRARHFPNVAQFLDVRDFGDRALASAIGERDAGSVELVCGGFPCQDLSVAGKRAGLTGARSGLFWEFVRVARELRPTWLLVENVPGLRSSSKGRDYGTLLHALDELGYFVEGATLDSRYFGVPQRRRRMFFVGHLGGPPSRPVLFEPEGGAWNPATGRTTGEDIAGTLGAGTPGARGWRGDLDSSGAYIPEVGRALTKTMGKHHDDDTDTLVAHALTAGGADASEDGTGRGTPIIALRASGNVGSNNLGVYEHGDAPTLDTTGNLAIAATLSVARGGGRRREDDVNLAYALRRDPGGIGQGHNTTFVAATSVRRLTPTECERLQGFPDGWTCLCGCEPYSTNACKCPDGPRYAALGNAVTVPVAYAIGRSMRAA